MLYEDKPVTTDNIDEIAELYASIISPFIEHSDIKINVGFKIEDEDYITSGNNAMKFLECITKKLGENVSQLGPIEIVRKDDIFIIKFNLHMG